MTGYLRSGRRSASIVLGCVAILLIAMSPSATAAPKVDDRGNHKSYVLSPNARPYGISLRDMAAKTALFTTNGNSLDFYPRTPLQVLYASSFEFSTPNGGWLFTGGNNFTVRGGTKFYVPLQNATDSPPVVGNWPSNDWQAKRYFFDKRQLGARDYEIVVDGRRTLLGPDYVAGPVRSPAPLGDGGGNEIITLGAFIGPLPQGIHTVQISGQIAGKALQEAYDIAFLAGDFTYTIEVKR